MYCTPLLNFPILPPPERTDLGARQIQSKSQFSGPMASPLSLGILPCAMEITSFSLI